MLDVAEGQEAKLSSILESYHASIATKANGESDFFHTGHEAMPWWEVDLGVPCKIHSVHLYNRDAFQERCDRLVVLTSLDGSHWRPLYWKTDDAVFGSNDQSKLVIEVEPDCVARHVRVQKTTYGCLHLRRCKVLGEPASPSAIKAAEGQARWELDRFVRGRRGKIHFADAFHLFLDEDYRSDVVQVIESNRYEHRERSLASALLRHGDCVVEAGTAIGLVSMNVAAIIGAENITTFDANPSMVNDALTNFKYNRLPIRCYNGVLRNRSKLDHNVRTKFYIDQYFWASRLDAGPTDNGIVQVVDVPYFTLEDQIEERGANVLICDIEGGEFDLLMGADLGRLRLIIVEIHFWALGDDRLNRMARSVVLQGFDIDLRHTGDSMVVFKRVEDNT